MPEKPVEVRLAADKERLRRQLAEARREIARRFGEQTDGQMELPFEEEQ